MNNKNIGLFVLFVAILFGCRGNNSTSNNSGSTVEYSDSNQIEVQDTCITVDINGKYPHRELILQEIMDVEYVPLESSDEFLCQGIVQAVGKDILVVRNAVNDGNIYIFDRKGKGIRMFNHKGQGPGEYIINLYAFLDDERGEIYVDNVMQDVLVYDFDGNYKKSINRNNPRWINTMNYDSDYIIVRESPVVHKGMQVDNQRFMLISKHDSQVSKDFRIYFTDKIEWGLTSASGGSGRAPRPFPIVPLHDSWLLVEHSSDTIFKLSSDYSLTPLIVRTPSVQEEEPVKFLLPCAFTDRYYFMEILSMEADLSQKKEFPRKRLAYDIGEDTLFEYTVYNNDFVNQDPIYFTMQETTNQQIVFCQKIEAHDLMVASEKGYLKGELKEIASTLNENSNAVIMLVKPKNI